MNPPPILIARGDLPETHAHRCPVWWCNNLHDLPNDPHFGSTADFVVSLDAYNAGRTRREAVSVGLDQVEHNGELLVSICSTQGTLWLTRDEAKRLAVHLVQLDLNANGVG